MKTKEHTTKLIVQKIMQEAQHVDEHEPSSKNKGFFFIMEKNSLQENMWKRAFLERKRRCHRKSRARAPSESVHAFFLGKLRSRFFDPPLANSNGMEHLKLKTEKRTMPTSDQAREGPILMSQRRWFGTDGIRGPFGTEPMTPDFVRRCGWAIARYFIEHATPGAPACAASNSQDTRPPPRILIGRDTRASGLLLEESLIQGLVEGGAHAHKLGVLPTAAVSFLTMHDHTAGGIMISASHNPAADNGLKCFGPDGFKLTDAAELEIERLIDQAPPASSMREPDTLDPATHAPSASNMSNAPNATRATRFAADPSAVEQYDKRLLECMPRGFSLKGMRIVADLAHGAAWQTTPGLLRRLGAELTLLADTPDGRNINQNCGAVYPEMLQAKVKDIGGGAIGLAYDGDADRLMLVDETGSILNGDAILAIVGRAYLESNRLKQKTLVATQMSNLALEEALQPYDGKVLRTDVGDRYVLAAMRERGLNVGGEQSGHFIFLDDLPSGDGLLSALHVLAILAQSHGTLHELAALFKPYPQKLVNMPVAAKPPLESLDDVQAALRRAEKILGAQGRLLLRYSGTENKLRLLIESKDAVLIESVLAVMVPSIEQSIGLNQAAAVQ